MKKRTVVTLVVCAVVFVWAAFTPHPPEVYSYEQVHAGQYSIDVYVRRTYGPWNGCVVVDENTMAFAACECDASGQCAVQRESYLVERGTKWAWDYVFHVPNELDSPVFRLLVRNGELSGGRRNGSCPRYLRQLGTATSGGVTGRAYKLDLEGGGNMGTMVGDICVDEYSGP